MPVSEKQKEYAKRHFEKLDEIKIRPVQGTKARWRQEAETRGLSLTQFIVECVEKEIACGKCKEAAPGVYMLKD